MSCAASHAGAGRYREAAAAARAGHEANPLLPSPPVWLAAALAQLGQTQEARAIVADYLRRNPGYRAQDTARFLRGRDASYLAGRDRVIASLREAGMP
jgi:predicted Zn-dependent protease